VPGAEWVDPPWLRQSQSHAVLTTKPGQVVFQHLPCYKIAKRVKLTGYNKKYNAVVENLHVTCTYRPSQVGLEQLWLVRGPHASWKVLDFFSLKFQDLESAGKSLWSWKVLGIEA